ncbi:MAG: PQQ-dependent sugar dehydrogenase [Acidimicrobiia bacterium]
MLRGARAVLILLVVLAAACSTDQQLAPTHTTATTTAQTGSSTTATTTTTAGSTTVVETATTTTLPPLQGVQFDEAASGFNDPVFVTIAPGSSDLFVVEQGGTIKIVRNGQILDQPFLDIHGLVTSAGNEQGLLGLAFDPNYPNDPRVFVDYTNTSGNTTVASYRVVDGVADPSSATVLLAVKQPASNHNGGMVVFGPDGYLYIGLGDGGAAGDKFGNGQNTDTPLAAILRIDVSGPAGYTIPPGNPFTGGAPEIWEFGLRNPWRFSFDHGLLYIGDVGQDHYEEVDVSPADQGGLDFGWPITEGLHCYKPSRGCDTTGITMPVIEYSHTEGCSITGGYVYRGAAIPELDGTYFYADYCSGWIRSFHYVDGAATDEQQWKDSIGNVTSFGLDADGELLVVTRGGTIYRMVPVR